MMDALAEELVPAEGGADPASTFIWLDVFALNIAERAISARDMCPLLEEVQGSCHKGKYSCTYRCQTPSDPSSRSLIMIGWIL